MHIDATKASKPTVNAGTIGYGKVLSLVGVVGMSDSLYFMRVANSEPINTEHLIAIVNLGTGVLVECLTTDQAIEYDEAMVSMWPEVS